MTSEDSLQVIFVCTANICRSAYAEVRMRQILDESRVPPGRLVVSSQGTHAVSGVPGHEEMVGHRPDLWPAMAQHRSRPLSLPSIHAADLVIAMTNHHREHLLAEDSLLALKVLVWDQFWRTLERIDAELRGRELLGVIRRARSDVRPDDGVPDPIRGGAEAMRKAAEQIDRKLPYLAGRLLGGNIPSLHHEVDTI